MFSFKENHNKPLTNANHLIMGRVINQDIGGHIRTEMVKKANTRRTNPDGSKKNNKLNKSIANGFFYLLATASVFIVYYFTRVRNITCKL